MTMMTPIQQLPDLGGAHIFMKREDLLPFSFGGNKVRIAAAFFADMKKQGCDVMIGYGNARSNLCRVLSAMACREQVPCVIISPDDEDGSRTETFNSRLVRASGARIRPCNKTKVRETVEAVLDEYRAAGYKPYYINGNAEGRGNEAVSCEAYIRVAGEIAAQEAEMGLRFDRIYLASGTGMTQAGLMIGAALEKRNWQITGISIARPADRCREVIRERTEAWKKANGCPALAVEEPSVCDAYLMGGYGQWEEPVAALIRETVLRHGIPLDPTYSGKAFYGMREELARDGREENVLFIHTGGGPLFFDFMQHEF